MRIVLSLLALSSCLLLTTAHGSAATRIDAAMRIEGEIGRGLARMHVPGTTWLQVAGDFTRRLSGAATRWSG